MGSSEKTGAGKPAPDLKKLLCEIRSRIPKMTCLDDCGACCGHVPWSRFEWDQLPQKFKEQYDQFTWACCFKKDNRCVIHEYRPIFCRMFGVGQGMACPKGVLPDNVLVTEQGAELIKTYVKNFFNDTEV